MAFLEEISEGCFLLHAYIKPNSKSQTIINDLNNITISLRSKPIKNKANKELINLIKKRLKLTSDQIQIVSGLKSSKKIIKLMFKKKMSSQDIIAKLIN